MFTFRAEGRNPEKGKGIVTCEYKDVESHKIARLKRKGSGKGYTGGEKNYGLALGWGTLMLI